LQLLAATAIISRTIMQNIQFTMHVMMSVKIPLKIVGGTSEGANINSGLIDRLNLPNP